MIDFTKTNWADYPDTTTPITASELNRMEQGIYDAVSGVNNLPTTVMVKTLLCNAILWAISGLHNDYTHTVIEQEVETIEDVTMSLIFDKSVYNADEDGLLVTVNGVLMNPNGYTATVEDNASHIRFGTTAALQIGQTVDLHIYKKPPTSANNNIGSSYPLTSGLSQSIVGQATDIEEV